MSDTRYRTTDQAPRFRFIALAGVAALFVLASCRTPGKLRYQDAHRTIEASQPTDPTGAATITIGPDGSVTLSTPPATAPASYTEKATANGLMILGGLFAVLAVASFVLRKSFPLIPSNAPVGLAVASGVCFAMPTVIDEYLPWILGAGALWLAWIWFSYRHNLRLKQSPPNPEKGTPDA